MRYIIAIIALLTIMFYVESKAVTEVDMLTIESEVVAETNQGKSVLVEYYAPWCGACAAMAPMIEQAEIRFKGKVKVVKINLDENHILGSDVKYLPTIELRVGKDKKNRLIGTPTSQALLEAWISANL